MYVFWAINYFDRDKKSFGRRELVVETSQLEPATKAAIELLVETRNGGANSGILKFRHLFREVDRGTRQEDAEYVGSFATILVEGYYESESGEEITLDEAAAIKTGNPNTRVIPSGYRSHDVNYMFSNSSPAPVDDVSLSNEELGILGYFCRDLKELTNSALMKDGPGSIQGGGSLPNGRLEIKTAVSDEEIRSFVMIFRRLYMEKHERANFLKSVRVFCKAIDGHPLATWVKIEAKCYEEKLLEPPYCPMFRVAQGLQFTRKRLIDVFLYTQYAHQPDERRQRQYRECLSELQQNEPLLFWLFLNEIWRASLTFRNAGRVIDGWFHRYCEENQVTADVLDSIRLRNPGIGQLEKEETKQNRLFREKVQQMAAQLWEQQGRPSGGPLSFMDEAEKQLRELLP